MVLFIYNSVKTDLARIWGRLVDLQHVFDRKVMQDLEIESRCVLSSMFMMLCRVCMVIVL